MIIVNLSAYQRGMGFMLTLVLISLSVSWIAVFTIPNIFMRSRNRGLARHPINGLPRYRVVLARILLEELAQMNLLDLTCKLETTPVHDYNRDVKIIVIGKDGQPLYSLQIDRIGQVQEWTECPDGRKQLQYKMCIVTEPITDEHGPGSL